MLIDAFTFYNEFDLLELRLNILDGIVDRFVLVEGNRTHWNAEKPLYFSQDRSGRFDRFKHKIVPVLVEDWPAYDNLWVNEVFQRDCILRGLVDCDEQDIVILSDLDEIPNPDVIKQYTPDRGILALEQDLFYYYYNNRQMGSTKWTRAKIMTYKDVLHGLDAIDYATPDNPFDVTAKTTPTKIRLYDTKRVLKDGGWHFAYIMPPERMADKINTFCHQELNRPEFKNLESIRHRMRNGLDLFDRGTGRQFCAVALDNHLPRYLVEHREKYEQYILPYNAFDYYAINVKFFFRFLGDEVCRFFARIGRSIKKRL